MSDITVKCTRCRHACKESEWVLTPSRRFGGCREASCPRCGCKSYYDCTPQVAWCFASGLVEIGDALPSTDAIEIARGPKYALRGQLSVYARHGKGDSVGKLLVPGIPEASGQQAALRALDQWLQWINTRKPRDGVTYSKEVK